MNYQEFPPGYAEGFSPAPVFNANFKIPVKSQPPPPGTTDADQESIEPAIVAPPPPLPPMPQIPSEMYQSPMFNYDPSYWAQSGYPHYGLAPVPAPVPQEETRKRKLDIDYMGKDDPVLPDELKKMFNALHCVLCDVKVNSPISAKMHYSSKSHDKKINQWLIDYCKKTGASMPKRQRKVSSIEEAQKAGPKGPNALFCELCQIALTSVQHANQHYMGKKHRMVAAGKSRPKSQKPVVDNSGRFGIGSSFVQGLQPLDEPGQTASLAISPPSTPVYDATTPGDPFSPSSMGEPVQAEVMSPPQTNYTVPKPGTIGPSLVPVINTTVENAPKNSAKNLRYCEVCDISVTSDQQMETHISGQKHQKKCKQIGIATELNPRARSDFSSCRTPSGQYYCISCDLTVATEALYSGHIQRHHSHRQLKPTLSQRNKFSKEGWISNGLAKVKPQKMNENLVNQSVKEPVVKSVNQPKDFENSVEGPSEPQKLFVTKDSVTKSKKSPINENKDTKSVLITLELSKNQHPEKNKKRKQAAQAKINEELHQKRMKMMDTLNDIVIKTEPCDEILQEPQDMPDFPIKIDKIKLEVLENDIPIVNVPIIEEMQDQEVFPNDTEFSDFGLGVKIKQEEEFFEPNFSFEFESSDILIKEEED